MHSNQARAHGAILREFVQAKPDWRKQCSNELKDEIDDFTTRLQAGLEAALEQINARSKRLLEIQGGIKEKLAAVHERQRSSRAYRRPGPPASSLINSEA